MVSCFRCISHEPMAKEDENDVVHDRAVKRKQDQITKKKKKKKKKKKPMRLKCSVHNYQWGIVGNGSEVARLFALNSGSDVHPDKPYAELWIGAHESGPSFVEQYSGNGGEGGGGGLSLKKWIAENPNVVLGNRVADKWGANLPFLFKVLSVEKALSIQAHPDKELAKALHKSQPTVYKDANHKPEMALAITHFEALCGFISVKELKDVLSSVPEIAECIRPADTERVLHVNEQDGIEEGKTVLKSIFSQLMLSSEDKIFEMISSMKRRFDLKIQEDELTDKERLVLKLESQYPGDAGVVAAFLLNYVKLSPGEAIYLGANEPHAYICGECVECMANSDNVVRAGLTSKQRDTKTLLSMLKYRQGYPEILRGVTRIPYTRSYVPPLDEFEVDSCSLPQAASVVFPSVPGPSVLLFTKGRGIIAGGFPEEKVEEGQVLFVPAYTGIGIIAESTELQLYRAGVNSRFFKDM